MARWDDEVFMIIMPHTEAEGAQTFTERLRERVEKMSHKYEDRSLKVTITLGVAEYNKVMEKTEIIERTEGALINGIRLGKNKVMLDARYAIKSEWARYKEQVADKRYKVKDKSMKRQNIKRGTA